LKNYDLDESISQPELISRLFQQAGSEFVKDLNGDFVIFIYMPAKDEFYLYRDHKGVAPVAYVADKEAFVFSTDIIGLCSVFSEGSQVNVEPLLAEFRFVDMKQTPNKEIVKLLPGHYLKSNRKDLHIIKYWKPEKLKVDKNLTYEQVLQELKILLTDAIRIRSDTRFIASAHVSGGLDSGIVSSLARREYQHQEIFYGYSWSPENLELEKPEFDERDLINEFCTEADITPVFVKLFPDDYIRLSKNYFRNFGAFPEEKVLDHAKSNNVNLIFSGWGGDEFLSKGERGLNSDLFFGLKWQLLLARYPARKYKKLLKTILYDVLIPSLHILTPGQRRAHQSYTRYLKDPYKKNHKPSLRKFMFYRSRRQLHLGFLNHYHLSARTEKWAVNGFLHGVEYRYPLLDRRIIEYMLQVPTNLMIRGAHDRIIMRDLGAGLVPEGLRWTKKGIDPSVIANAHRNCKESASVFLNEMDDFKANPDMSFIDFKALKEDAIKFMEDPESQNTFTDGILYIKMLHEFMKSYRCREVTALK